MKGYLRVITFSTNIKMCRKMSFAFVFSLLIAILLFISASKGGWYIHAIGDEEHDIIKDFSTGNLMYQ